MARDKYSGEAAQLFQSFGWYKKFPDAGWRDKQAKIMQAQDDPGLADSILIGMVGARPAPIFIEHKTATGDGRRFAFDGWVERQRLFCVAAEWMGIPYWMFLVMGVSIRDRDYPRVAYLLRGETMFDLIRAAGERKSLSYETARTRLSRERLIWAQGRWHLPDDHPFNVNVRGEGYAATYGQWSHEFRRRLQTVGSQIPAPQTPQGQRSVPEFILQPDLLVG